jgi:O-acetyl-ADP-ribose deacetylase (regulator of RNase III)
MMKPEIRDRIQLRQGDITRMQVDAIVNAANRSLLGGGGVDGAIHRAAGPKLVQECRRLGGCPTGEARITAGYDLPARFVIHTVGPVYSGSLENRVQLARCYENSLQLAAAHAAATVAFPAISCGAYGYPIAQACEIAIETTARFLETEPAIKQVLFVLFSKNDFDVYNAYLGK